VAAVVGMLWGSATPVGACQCLVLTPGEAVNRAHVILVGDPVSLAETPSRVVKEGHVSNEMGRRTKATITVERYLKGRGPATTEVLEDWCLGAFARDRIGESHLLVIRFEGEFEKLATADGCLGSGPVEDPWMPISLSQVEGITGAGEPPDDSLDEPRPPDTAQFPFLPSVALAVLGPLAFLAGTAFAWRRGWSANGERIIECGC